MTLSKQMIIFIASLLIVLLAGTFWLNFTNTKIFLENQLESHAQDTATSLGLSLSSVADIENPASMETMVNAVFDRGYYSHIKIIDINNKVIYLREHPQAVANVPTWFINSIPIKAPIATSLIQSGWSPVGTLQVQSHPGYAYMQLWQTTIGLLTWFSLAMLLSIIIAHFTITAMLQPLKKMEKQAKAIVKKEYILQADIPNTIEFKQVVIAINSMVLKMKEVFERDAKMATKLQKLAYQDGVTSMSNRQHFEMQADSLLDPRQEASAGVLCLIRLEELKGLNDQFGYLVGDKVICGLADSLRQQLVAQKALYARLNGSELIAILPDLTASQIHEQTNTIANYFPELLASLNIKNSTSYISIAVTPYKPGANRGSLLAKLDYAIDKAKHLGKNQAYFYETEEDKASEDLEWGKIISEAISEQRFTLFQQPAYTEDLSEYHQELFIRMQETDGTIKPAGYFMPAVNKLNRVFEIDQLVIKLAIKYLTSSNTNSRLAINLSQEMLCQEKAIDWLLQSITDLPPQNLAFELSEHLIISEKTQASSLIKQLKSLKIPTGIDHFGSQFGDMQYLQNLRPDYIKLDAAFSKAIDKDEQTRSYIASLCDMANSLDITVIAMAVENDAQKQAFNDLGIKHYQGYHFSAPSPLNEVT